MKRQIKKSVKRQACAFILAAAILAGGHAASPALAATQPPDPSAVNSLPALDSVADQTGLLVRDPLTILGLNYQELLELQPGGQLQYSTGIAGKILSQVQFTERWFAMEKPVLAEYAVSGDKTQRIQQITLHFPKETNREELMQQITRALNEPTLQETSQPGDSSDYSAGWIKGGVVYNLKDTGGFMEMSILPALFQEAEKYNLPENTYILQQALEDVTGDGQKERVTLLGKRFDDTAMYMEHLYLLAEDPAKAEEQGILIKLPEESDGGYGAKMQLLDFNGDKVKDLFVTANTGGSGGYYNHHIYSLKDGQERILYQPAEENQLNITGSLQDHYQAVLFIKETKQSYTINLQDRKDLYQELNVYKGGKLLEKVEVWHGGYNSLAPVDVNQDGIFELAGVQTIKGTSNADSIAQATSLWRFNGRQWDLLQAEVSKRE